MISGKRRIIALVVALSLCVIAFCFVGCDDEESNEKITTTTITVVANIPEAGTVTGGGVYRDGGTATISATTNPGYTWLGWQIGNESFLSREFVTYTFPVPYDDVTITAMWACYTVTTTTNLEGAGTYTQMTKEKVTEGEIVTLEATTNEGYTWLGWYDGDDKVSEGDSTTYTFRKMEFDETYTAKWVKNS